ncbi:WD40/YVTN/BNR-like repeat-containing protein [Duganella sp. PWIR1]
MMKIFAFCATLALLPACAAAGMFPALTRPAVQVQAPERQVLLAAAQAGARVVAVGERGVVALSDDGGLHWRQAAHVPVSTTLTAVSFVGDRLGWAVGHGGVILHTVDGGERWSLQADGATLAQRALQAAEEDARRNPDNAAAARALKGARLLVADGPDKPLLDVSFEDARHGWAVGAYNLFFETRDGGATWNSIGGRLDNPRALHLHVIRSSGDTVYVAGEQGQIHRSLDGGRSFSALASPYKGSWFALALEGDGALVAAGLRGKLFRSIDHGESWQAIGGAPPVSILSATPLPQGRVLLANQGGKLYTSAQGAPLQALPVQPMPPLAGLLLLKDGGLLAFGLGGAMRLPAQDHNGKTK